MGRQQEEDAAALGRALGVLRACGFLMGQKVKPPGGLRWRRDPVQEWRKRVPLGKAWVSQLLELPCQKGSRPQLLWENWGKAAVGTFSLSSPSESCGEVV